MDLASIVEVRIDNIAVSRRVVKDFILKRLGVCFVLRVIAPVVAFLVRGEMQLMLPGSLRRVSPAKYP